MKFYFRMVFVEASCFCIVEVSMGKVKSSCFYTE